MQVVPGVGWDNLRNTESGLVAGFSYSQCKVTYDRRYLIPDETFAIPIKTSVLEKNAELFDHWDSWKSATSNSINVGFDFFGRIGGKFSREYQDIKSKQFKENAITTRIELRYKFYTLKLLPDFQLHPGFKNRLLEIASLLKTNDTDSAIHLAELVVRDYGTHYLTSVDSGALLIQEDNLESSITSRFSGDANSITTAAGADFYDILQFGVNAGFSYYNGQTNLQSYRTSRTSSKVYAYGGPPFKVGMDVSKWDSNLTNNLVAIDRSGRPLHYAVSSSNLPELSNPSDVFEVRKLIQNAIGRYYAFNTHIGCTDPKASNFDYQANSEGNTCRDSSLNHTFGGIFQTCLSSGNEVCKTIIQKNPLTGGFSCPPSYVPVVILRGTSTAPMVGKRCKPKKVCRILGIFKCHTEDECTFYESTERAYYNSYWCVADGTTRPDTGYIFGGLYSNDINNPITRSRTCPTHYYDLKLGSHARVCVSEDPELGNKFALPFGGFFSCKSGNPLAREDLTGFQKDSTNWPMRCPGGFTQHLALIDKDCRVNFCVKANALLRSFDADLVIPPFEPKPARNENATNTMFAGGLPMDFDSLMMQDSGAAYPLVLPYYYYNHNSSVVESSSSDAAFVRSLSVWLSTAVAFTMMKLSV